MFQNFPSISNEDVKKLKKTIKLLSGILADLKIECRVFGSVIPAAILGSPQRKLADIDLMIDTKDKNKLFWRLKQEGYNLEERRFRFLGIIFVWAEAVKSNLLSLTIFLGKFDANKNFTIDISKSLKAVAYSQAIKPTLYNFYNCRFIGIPTTSAYFGALASRGNPKRKYDLAVFEAKKIERPPKGYSVIGFYYKERKLRFLYPLTCFLQDVLGRISLFFGGNYDFWRR